MSQSESVDLAKEIKLDSPKSPKTKGVEEMDEELKVEGNFRYCIFYKSRSDDSCSNLININSLILGTN